MTTVSTTERDVDQPPAGVAEAPTGRSTGWWGMTLFICTEGATFAAFIASYFYLRFAKSATWPPSSDKLPHLLAPSIGTGVLVLSCIPMAAAIRLTARGRRGLGLLGVAIALLGGCAFLVLQVIDWAAEYPASTPSKDAYGSLLFVITGLHSVHVLIGVGMLLFLVASFAVGRLGRQHSEPVAIVGMYWYFMSVVALAVYATVYLSPYL